MLSARTRTDVQFCMAGSRDGLARSYGPFVYVCNVTALQKSTTVMHGRTERQSEAENAAMMTY